MKLPSREMKQSIVRRVVVPQRLRAELVIIVNSVVVIDIIGDVVYVVIIDTSIVAVATTTCLGERRLRVIRRV